MITRFAPSPTGPLHLGHAYSALLAHEAARASGGRFLLRIEDIDTQRSRPEWEDQLKRDLAWLGISWDAEPLRQSDRHEAYQSALDHLWDQGLLYPCTCTRADIKAALSAPQEGANGPDGPIYPGTCRLKHPRTGPRPRGTHLRLDIARAARTTQFQETGPLHKGSHVTDVLAYPETVGDIVIARRDFGTSYHLSVVLDDAAQNVSDIFRGDDLFDATRIHVLLQDHLGLCRPRYHHHTLIRDQAGKRLAKRDDARGIATFRDAGWTAQDVRHHLGQNLTAPSAQQSL